MIAHSLQRVISSTNTGQDSFAGRKSGGGSKGVKVLGKESTTIMKKILLIEMKKNAQRGGTKLDKVRSLKAPRLISNALKDQAMNGGGGHEEGVAEED